jgi:hypothetical protein
MTALAVLHRICLAVQLVCAILFVVEAFRFRRCCRGIAQDLRAAMERLEKL